VRLHPFDIVGMKSGRGLSVVTPSFVHVLCQETISYGGVRDLTIGMGHPVVFIKKGSGLTSKLIQPAIILVSG
jgi:hypothetical protein